MDYGLAYRAASPVALVRVPFFLRVPEALESDDGMSYLI